MRKTIWVKCLAALLLLGSCKKEAFNFLSEKLAPLPVTVTNLYGMYNGTPTVSASLSGGGTITITLAIPSGSGRTIKEITRVAVATTPTNYKVVETTAGLYNTAPIPGGGTTVTFTTSLAEYTAKTGSAVTSSGTATSFLGRYFYFLLTLDNGEQLVPVPVRVYVNS